MTLSLPYLPRTAVGDRELAQAVVIDAGVREGTFLQRVSPQQGFQAAAVLRDQPFLLQGLIGVCKETVGGKGKKNQGGTSVCAKIPSHPAMFASFPTAAGSGEGVYQPSPTFAIIRCYLGTVLPKTPTP